MRLQRGVRTFAAVVTAAAITAPAGQAKFDNTTYPPLGTPRAVVTHHPGSTDWALIGLSAAGAVTLRAPVWRHRAGSAAAAWPVLARVPQAVRRQPWGQPRPSGPSASIRDGRSVTALAARARRSLR